MKKILAALLSVLLLISFCGCNESINEIYDLAFGDLEESSFIKSPFSVCFVDVGQGDCTVVQCSGKTMIIDAGEEGSEKAIASSLRKLNIDFFDYAVGTHDHSDHVGSLDNIIEEYAVGKVLLSPYQSSGGSYGFAAVKKAAQTKNIPVEEAKAGYEFHLGEAKLTVLSPKEKSEEVNDTSLVIKAQYKDISFIFMADAEKESENIIIESGAEINADVIKVGHHGSNTSSSYHFLRDVMPKYAVISLGEGNSYGHPHEEVMSRFNDCAATVYRTDLHGDICFYSDGSSLQIETETGKSPVYSTRETPTAEEYIGNLKSHKYHTPECKNLPKEENRILFASVEEAKRQGYEACGSCNP